MPLIGSTAVTILTARCGCCDKVIHPFSSTMLKKHLCIVYVLICCGAGVSAQTVDKKSALYHRSTVSQPM